VVVLVAADVVHGAELAAAEIDDGDLGALHPEPPGLTQGHVARLSHLDQHRCHASSSSAAMARSRPCRTSGRVTRSSTSWKKPNTMSRWASSNGIPRLCM